MRKARRIYDDPHWQRLARRHLAFNPICAVAGCGKAAKHADHIVPVRRAPHRWLDPTNVQSLCHHHHSQLTQAYDVGTIKGACDANGYPLDPSHPWAQPDNAAAIKAANAGPAKPSARHAARLKQQYIKGERQ